MNSDRNNLFNDSLNNLYDTLEISEEEIFHLSANIIQSVFKGYILRKILDYRIHLYLNYLWAFNFLDNFLKFKLNKKLLDNLLLNDYFKTNKKHLKDIYSTINYKTPQIFIRKKYIFLRNFISIRNEDFSLNPKHNLLESNKLMKNSYEINKEIKTFETKIPELNGKYNKKNNLSKKEKSKKNICYKCKNYSNPNIFNNPLTLVIKLNNSSSYKNLFNIKKN